MLVSIVRHAVLARRARSAHPRRPWQTLLPPARPAHTRANDPHTAWLPTFVMSPMSPMSPKFPKFRLEVRMTPTISMGIHSDL